MEEDIKKCEEFINLRFLYGKLSFTKTQLYEYQKAITNVLSSLKQLEEENKNMREEYLVNNPGMVKYLKDNYIFKSKVEEKIEELKEIKQEKYERVQVFDDTTNACCYQIVKKYDYEIAQFAIKTLQELLREE